MSISLGSVRALFLSPRSANQHVDVCCISIKHSLFQRVHVGLFTVWFYFHAPKRFARVSWMVALPFVPRCYEDHCYEVKGVWFRNCMVCCLQMMCFCSLQSMTLNVHWAEREVSFRSAAMVLVSLCLRLKSLGIWETCNGRMELEMDGQLVTSLQCRCYSSLGEGAELKGKLHSVAPHLF